MANPFTLYWRSLFLIVYPCALLFMPIMWNRKDVRCFFITVLMAGYWVLDVAPMAITALIPVILFPLMGVMDGGKTTRVYLSGPIMLLIGSVAMGLAINKSNLHRRLLYKTLSNGTFSMRRFHFVVFVSTYFWSLWIPNLITVTMMVEALEATLTQLNDTGICPLYRKEDDVKKPTKLCVGLYMGIAYAATIGGLGNLTGTPVNVTLMGVYRVAFKNSEDITFNKRFTSGFALSIVLAFITCFILQLWYLGLFRGDSEDGQATVVGEDKGKAAKAILAGQLDELGSLTPNEVLVPLLFIATVVLWFLRWPEIMPGWPSFFTKLQVGDACPVMTIVLTLFILPGTLQFLHSFSSDEEKRPQAAGPGLMTWRLIHAGMLWDTAFVVGSGFLISHGIAVSKLDLLIVKSLGFLDKAEPIVVMVGLTFFATVLTQLTANCITGSIILPFLPHVSKKLKCHPVYLMVPVHMACSLGFCLRISTRTNRQAANACNMSNLELFKVGLLVALIGYGLLLADFLPLGPIIWDLKYVEQKAEYNATSEYDNIWWELEYPE